MFDHSVFANETLATDFTGEGFFAGMEAHVPSQIRFVIELLRAHFTLVRLVSSMFCQVFLKLIPVLRPELRAVMRISSLH